MRITFQENTHRAPDGKLADAELHFTEGPLAGCKLVGFAVWTRRNGSHNVTFPARTYQVNGERRSFQLLRAITDAAGTDRVRDAILDAWRDHSAGATDISTPAPVQAAPVVTLPAPVITVRPSVPAGAVETASEKAERLAAAKLAAQQPGGIPLTDLMPGGKFGAPRRPVTPQVPALAGMAPMGLTIGRPAPQDVPLPGLATVRETENPDPAPVAELPRALPTAYELRAQAGAGQTPRFNFE